jgi:hypothetical protein
MILKFLDFIADGRTYWADRGRGARGAPPIREAPCAIAWRALRTLAP